MSYPYSSFYLEAQWLKLKVAEYFDSGWMPLSAIGSQKVCAQRCEDQWRALLDRKLFIAGGSLMAENHCRSQYASARGLR